MSYGRRIIYTNEDTITLGNIRDVLRKAYNEHQMNRNAITRLWDYYRGKTEILHKTKEARESTNHKYGRKGLLSCKPSYRLPLCFRQKRVDKLVGWWYYQCARGAEVSAERVPLNLSS